MVCARSRPRGPPGRKVTWFQSKVVVSGQTDSTVAVSTFSVHSNSDLSSVSPTAVCTVANLRVFFCYSKKLRA